MFMPTRLAPKSVRQSGASYQNLNIKLGFQAKSGVELTKLIKRDLKSQQAQVRGLTRGLLPQQRQNFFCKQTRNAQNQNVVTTVNLIDKLKI